MSYYYQFLILILLLTTSTGCDSDTEIASRTVTESPVAPTVVTEEPPPSKPIQKPSVSLAGKGDAEKRKAIPTIKPSLIIPSSTALGTSKQITGTAMSPDGAKFVVVCTDGQDEDVIRCLDTASGELLWSVDASGRMGTAACSETVVFVVTDYPKTHSLAISLSDGSVVSRGAPEQIKSKPAGRIVIDDERMQAVYINQGLMTVNLTDGVHTLTPWPADFWADQRQPAKVAYNASNKTFVMTCPPNHWATWRLGDTGPVNCEPLKMDDKPLRWEPLFGLAGENLVLGKSKDILLVVDIADQKILQTSEDAFRQARTGGSADERPNRIALAHETHGISENGKFAILATQMEYDPQQKCVVYDVQDIDDPRAVVEVEFQTQQSSVGANWQAADYLSSRGSRISNDGKTIVFKTDKENVVVFKK